jgi:hypothetical protein
MGPPVDQVLVDGALPHPGSRGRCRDDVVEGLVLGAIGTMVGIPLGVLLSRLTLHIVSQTLVSLFLVVAIQRLMISPGIVITALGIGLAASLVSVAIPVREARLRLTLPAGWERWRCERLPKRPLMQPCAKGIVLA